MDLLDLYIRDCMYLSSGSGYKAHMVDCNRRYAFICQLLPSNCPNGYTPSKTDARSCFGYEPWMEDNWKSCRLGPGQLLSRPTAPTSVKSAWNLAGNVSRMANIEEQSQVEAFLWAPMFSSVIDPRNALTASNVYDSRHKHDSWTAEIGNGNNEYLSLRRSSRLLQATALYLHQMEP